MCGEGTWQRYAGLAGFCAALYTLALPLAYTGAVLHYRRALSEEEFFIRFGFLVDRYAEGREHFESVVLARKAVVVVCVTFVSPSAYIQGGAACIATVFFSIGECLDGPAYV